MNIEDLKDSELITELYERMTAPKESNIDRMIRESFERIDNIIELACDDLDELKKDYEPTFLGNLSGSDVFAYGRNGPLELFAAQHHRGINIADQMSGLPYPTGSGIFGSLGMAATGIFR